MASWQELLTSGKSWASGYAKANPALLRSAGIGAGLGVGWGLFSDNTGIIEGGIKGGLIGGAIHAGRGWFSRSPSRSNIVDAYALGDISEATAKSDKYKAWRNNPKYRSKMETKSNQEIARVRNIERSRVFDIQSNMEIARVRNIETQKVNSISTQTLLNRKRNDTQSLLSLAQAAITPKSKLRKR